MSWVKLDDQFFLNPKVISAGRDARDLYLAALTYTAGQLTDGYLPEGCILLVAAMAQITTAAESAKRLVDVGLWDKCKTGYTIHDYLDYNPSGDQVRAIRKERAEAGRRGAQKTNEARWGEGDAAVDDSPNEPANEPPNESATESATESAKVSANCQQNCQQNCHQNVAPSPSPSPYPIPVPEPVPVTPKSSARASTPERPAEPAKVQPAQPLQAYSFKEPDIGPHPGHNPDMDIRSQCAAAIDYWLQVGKRRGMHDDDKYQIGAMVKSYGWERVKAAMDAEPMGMLWNIQKRLLTPQPAEPATVTA
jgi:hypothetical protein